jgi:uncharacterized protein (TIGR02145 family)
MKKLFTLMVVVTFNICGLPQVPEKMSYQAVIRNNTNQLVTNHAVGMQISILQGSATGTPVFVETQTPNTNANGLVTIEIGGGTTVSGTFATIDWSAGSYFVKTEIDPSGGTKYTITGTNQLLSVPYSLYAKTSETSTESIDLKQQIKILEDNLIAAGTYKLSDIEGNQYNVVKIGTQVWMKENLKVTKYKDGTNIPFVPDGGDWLWLKTPGYCWPGYDLKSNNLNNKEYGASYNWYAVETWKLCPIGWHVPTNNEWITLIDYLGGDSVAGNKMREVGDAHWDASPPPEPGITNESGFTAFGAGFHDIHAESSQSMYADYRYFRTVTYWWTSTSKTTLEAYSVGLGMGLGGGGVVWLSYSKTSSFSPSTTNYTNFNYGYSVRCLRDN